MIIKNILVQYRVFIGKKSMKSTILCFNDSDKHFSVSIQEYIKRLWKDCELLNLKPVKFWSRDQIIQKETEIILEKIFARQKRYNWSVFLLSISWNSFSTEELQKKIAPHSRNLFLIWWAYWFNESALSAYITWKISFGRQTVPHWLAKLILLEQIYRVSTLHSGKKYHY